MNIIKVRPVGQSEAEALCDIARTTFLQAFTAGNAPATLEKYVAKQFTQAQIEKEMHCQGSEFYFAVQDEIIVGYLKLNRGTAQTETGLENALEIERIYALTSTHGKGVGQALYAKAIGIAQEAQFNWIWLGVWSQNPRAIRFYEKNGFVSFGTHKFNMGEEEQDDILMRKPLNIE